ncbi:MAG TPA: hypothetical protein VFQ40_09790 [Actinomycetota bacterium]|nr:hypothetical protein [Actinomycetota bacterium]
MTTTIEPERDLARRLLPFALPVLLVAVSVGSLLDGAGTATSAGIGVLAVAANLVTHAASIAWAARISPAAVMLVGVGGYVLRIATFALALALLDRLAWFSPVAFIAAFVPVTLVLLVVELKLLGGRMQADLWYFRERA